MHKASTRYLGKHMTSNNHKASPLVKCGTMLNGRVLTELDSHHTSTQKRVKSERVAMSCSHVSRCSSTNVSCRQINPIVSKCLLQQTLLGYMFSTCMQKYRIIKIHDSAILLVQLLQNTS